MSLPHVTLQLPITTILLTLETSEQAMDSMATYEKSRSMIGLKLSQAFYLITKQLQSDTSFTGLSQTETFEISTTTTLDTQIEAKGICGTTIAKLEIAGATLVLEMINGGDSHVTTRSTTSMKEAQRDLSNAEMVNCQAILNAMMETSYQTMAEVQTESLKLILHASTAPQPQVQPALKSEEMAGTSTTNEMMAILQTATAATQRDTSKQAILVPKEAGMKKTYAGNYAEMESLLTVKFYLN